MNDLGNPVLHFILSWLGFLFVAVAASQLAVIFPKFKLPLITGYLAIGLLSGHFVLQYVDKSNLSDLAPLNQFVLAFIGFSAGAELFLPELRDLFKTIFLSVGAISVITFALLTGVSKALMMSDVASSLVGSQSSACKSGVAMVIASIMTARSPASAIAIVKEMRAKGPFTRAFLGITVVSDVVVLVLFAVSVAYTKGGCSTDPGESGFSGDSILTLLASLSFAIILGYFVLGKVIIFLLYLLPHGIWFIKIPPKWLILPLGFGIFRLSDFIAHQSAEKFGYEISLEPLLMTIVAGYVATNQSRNRKIFLAMLQKVGPYVFIPFFTLTGASLDLAVLLKSAGLAVIVAILRFFSIEVGSVLGGIVAKAPPIHTKYMGLSLITQAGVSLGLAGQVGFIFPTWGPAVATAIVGVIVINQIIGPILCKIAIKRVGEQGKATSTEEDESGKSILILGINGYSLAIAERMRNAHWKVIMADHEESKFEYALRLNKSHANSDTHIPHTKEDIVKTRNRKLYLELDEDEPQPPYVRSTSAGVHIDDDGGGGATEAVDLDAAAENASSSAPTTSTTAAAAAAAATRSSPVLVKRISAHEATSLPPPVAASAAAAAAATAHDNHDNELEHIPDVQTRLIMPSQETPDIGTSDSAVLAPDVCPFNYAELATGLEPRSDVVLCMLDNESANILACAFFKNQLKFDRTIGAVLAPTSVDMYIKVGALPYYAFSASLNILYQYITAHRVHPAALVSVILPEAESFPQNIELLPFLRPPDTTHDEVADLRAQQPTPPPNLIDVDLGVAPIGDAPLAPTPAQRLERIADAMRPDRLAGTLRDGIVTTGTKLKEGLVSTGARLMELRDPIAMVSRGVEQMNVVPDSQRDEYLDSLAALHDTRPPTSNPIWMDLVNAPATETRRSDPILFASNQLPAGATALRSGAGGQSIFEEFHGMHTSGPAAAAAAATTTVATDVPAGPAYPKSPKNSRL